MTAIGATITVAQQRQFHKRKNMREQRKQQHAAWARMVLATDSQALLKHTLRKFRTSVCMMSREVREGFSYALEHGDDLMRRACVEYIHDAVIREREHIGPTEAVYHTGSVIWTELHKHDFGIAV